MYLLEKRNSLIISMQLSKIATFKDDAEMKHISSAQNFIDQNWLYLQLLSKKFVIAVFATW